MSRIQLVDNGKCTFSVDASSVVGRVTISAESTLGVLYPGYAAGQPITVERGSIKYITIFNGNPYGGPVAFTLTFSSATNLMASIVSVAFTMYQMMWSNILLMFLKRIDLIICSFIGKRENYSLKYTKY